MRGWWTPYSISPPPNGPTKSAAVCFPRGRTGLARPAATAYRILLRRVASIWPILARWRPCPRSTGKPPYAFNTAEAEQMAGAGADVVVAHMGLATKGSIGAKTARTLEESVREVQAIADAAKGVNKDVIVLCHGGPILMPEDASFILQRTKGVHGFYGASSVERLPAEIAITEQMRQFKEVRFAGFARKAADYGLPRQDRGEAGLTRSGIVPGPCCGGGMFSRRSRTSALCRSRLSQACRPSRNHHMGHGLLTCH